MIIDFCSGEPQKGSATIMAWWALIQAVHDGWKESTQHIRVASGPAGVSMGDHGVVSGD